MSTTIYELSERFNNIAELALDDSIDLDELEEALQGIEGEVVAKCQNGIGLIHSLNDRMEAYKKQEERFTKMRRTLENKIKRIKEYYINGLQAMGKTKIATDYGTMSVRKNGGKQSVEVDMDVLAKEYIITEMVEKADKDLIRDKLLAGEEIAGAKLLERGYHLSV